METEPAASLSFEEFCRSESAWDEMVLDSPAPVPFMSHAWLRQWWLHFGENAGFEAIVVRDGERFVAGAPLALRRRAGLTIAEIVGTGAVPTRGMGLADKADLVVRSDAGDAATRLVERLAGLFDRVDLVDAKGIGDGSTGAAALRRLAPTAGFARTIARSVSPYLPLDGTWEAYLATRSGNFRKHLRKYWRNLEKLGELDCRRLESRDDCRAWMAEVLAVNDDSWKAERGTNLFRHPRLRKFFVDVACELAQHDRLDLHVMRLDGTAIAYEICFDFGGRLFSYNGAYRKEFGTLSPGTALTGAVIRSACERGRVEYDMLRGREAYKRRWSELERTERHYLVSAGGLAARTYAWAGPYAKAKLKQNPRVTELSDRLAGWINRMRR